MTGPDPLPTRAEGKVCVIGGGLAGIAAALRLADAGARVTLLESRPELGGATYSFQRDDLTVDTGQHVFLRCYTAYRELLARLGTDGDTDVQKRFAVPVLLPGRSPHLLTRRPAPRPGAPAAPRWSRYRLLDRGERLAAVRAAAALRHVDPDLPATDERNFGRLADRARAAAAGDPPALGPDHRRRAERPRRPGVAGAGRPGVPHRTAGQRRRRRHRPAPGAPDRPARHPGPPGPGPARRPGAHPRPGRLDPPGGAGLPASACNGSELDRRRGRAGRTAPGRGPAGAGRRRPRRRAVEPARRRPDRQRAPPVRHPGHRAALRRRRRVARTVDLRPLHAGDGGDSTWSSRSRPPTPNSPAPPPTSSPRSAPPWPNSSPPPAPPPYATRSSPANPGPPSGRDPARGRTGRRRRPGCPGWHSPARGPTPAGRTPWRARYAAAPTPPTSSARHLGVPAPTDGGRTMTLAAHPPHRPEPAEPGRAGHPGTARPARPRQPAHLPATSSATGTPTAPRPPRQGKGLRPALALLGARAAGAEAAEGVPAAAAVELTHNFSLLHDDVLDGDTERRHRPTAWTVFGVGPAILAGDALIGLAYEALAESPGGGPAVRRLAVDVRPADRRPVRRPRIRKARRRSPSTSACRWPGTRPPRCSAGPAPWGALVAGAPAALVDGLSRFGWHLGVAFQLVDDLLGIWGDPARTGKPVGADLRARKKSLPVVRAMTLGGRSRPVPRRAVRPGRRRWPTPRSPAPPDWSRRAARATGPSSGPGKRSNAPGPNWPAGAARTRCTGSSTDISSFITGRDH